MNTKWTFWVGAGTVLAVLSSQVMAQPWGGGMGRGRGFGPGRGMGWASDRPGPVRQGMGQGGPGAWCPFGAGRRGQGFGPGRGMGRGWRADRPGIGRGGWQGAPGAWNPLGRGQGGQGWGGGQGMGRGGRADRPGIGRGGWQGTPGAWGPFGGRQLQAAPGWGQAGLGPIFARRLNLTDDQLQKIRDIVNKSRTETVAAIKEVLTDEQRRQLERMAPQGRRIREPASQESRIEGVAPPTYGRRLGPAQPGNVPDTDFRRGQGRGAGMGPRGQGPAGLPSGTGRGRGMNRPDAAAQAPADVRGADAAPRWNRGVPPIEQMFEQADTDKDGALTREELRAFHGNRAAGPGPQRE